MTFLARALRLLGIDRAVGFGLLAKVWTLASAPVTIYLVATFLSEEEQGLFYTMMSLLGLQVLFELGLATVLAQFVSHEFVSLHWAAKGRISGERQAFNRLRSLISKAVFWFGGASILLALSLIPAGIWFFREASAGLSAFWEIPWAIAVIGTAANLLLIPFVALESGSGNVAEVNRLDARAAIVGAVVLWACLLLGRGLYGLGALLVVKLAFYAYYFLSRRPLLFRAMVRPRRSPARGGDGISWWRDVWPMQWRVSLSWVAGYFVFQLFNPVVFHFHGAAEAGRMGITVAAANALTATSLTWLVANAPGFGRLVAQHDWRTLDSRFTRVMSQAAAVAFAGALVATVMLAWLQDNFSIGARFLPYPAAAMLLFGASVQVVISSFGVYLRAYKQEPFVTLSIVQALLQGTATLIAGRYYGTSGITASVLCVNAGVVLPLAVIIWLRCRARWQSQHY